MLALDIEDWEFHNHAILLRLSPNWLDCYFPGHVGSYRFNNCNVKSTWILVFLLHPSLLTSRSAVSCVHVAISF